MKIMNEMWPLKKFVTLRDRIEHQPIYQRGKVWTDTKRCLLIDSILRQMDIPKIYLRKLPKNSIYDYQIIDGQQRLSSVWKYVNDKNLLLELPPEFRNSSWNSKSFDRLSVIDAQRLRSFKVAVAIVTKATEAEVRELFARLQMGERLSPAELRNSVVSTIGTEIRNIAENHRFFKNCNFSSRRYKHQDLAAHAFALELTRGKKDVKAPDLKAMYLSYSTKVPASLAGTVAKNLNYLDDIQSSIPRILKRKWSFVDLYLLSSSTQKKSLPPAKELAVKLQAFENRRRMHVRKPEVLLVGQKRDKLLYEYILAFQLSSGESRNLQLRQEVLKTWLLNSKRR